MKTNKCTLRQEDGKLTHHFVCKNFETCKSICFMDNKENKHCDNFEYNKVATFIHKQDT